MRAERRCARTAEGGRRGAEGAAEDAAGELHAALASVGRRRQRRRRHRWWTCCTAAAICGIFCAKFRMCWSKRTEFTNIEFIGHREHGRRKSRGNRSWNHKLAGGVYGGTAFAWRSPMRRARECLCIPGEDGPTWFLRWWRWIRTGVRGGQRRARDAAETRPSARSTPSSG